MEKLQVHLTSSEVIEFCDALRGFQLDIGETIEYFEIIRAALERGETISIQRNDNHG